MASAVSNIGNASSILLLFLFDLLEIIIKLSLLLQLLYLFPYQISPIPPTDKENILKMPSKIIKQLKSCSSYNFPKIIKNYS